MVCELSKIVSGRATVDQEESPLVFRPWFGSRFDPGVDLRDSSVVEVRVCPTTFLSQGTPTS